LARVRSAKHAPPAARIAGRKGVAPRPRANLKSLESPLGKAFLSIFDAGALKRADMRMQLRSQAPGQLHWRPRRPAEAADQCGDFRRSTRMFAAREIRKPHGALE
jgi:hypothetical protein